MDQPLRRNARLLFTVLFISQVCGTPIFWSQPDCYQNQFSDVQYDTYESYQGPSYQETLKSMVDETLRAINEIVQITVKVTKQELASLSNVFQNPANVNCNDSGETAVAPEDFQFVAPQQPVKFPGDSMDNSYPLYENPTVAEYPPSTAGDKNSSGTTQSSAVLDNKVGTDGSSSLHPSSQPQNVTSLNNSAVPNNFTGNMSTSILSQNTSTEISSVDNNIDSATISTITPDGELSTSPMYSADNMDALFFSTELSITEDETSLSTITAGSTTSASDVTTTEIPTVVNRKPKL